MDIEIIKKSLQEDLQDLGDITSSAIFSNEISEYNLIAKDEGILAGRNFFEEVYFQVDRTCEVKFLFRDGDKINLNDTVASIKGKTKSILTAERVAINFLSHLSGIATKTSLFVSKISGKTQILDTRKTIPGLRQAEKYAVLCGGGQNHRLGLFDLVMIKDNHIDGAGSIQTAVKKIRDKWGNKFKIEVETRNQNEVEEALKQNVDIIMLDNMTDAEMKNAIEIIENRTKVEASGNMNLARINQVSKLGVDFISVGALTHTVKAFDFSLIKKKGRLNGKK